MSEGTLEAAGRAVRSLVPGTMHEARLTPPSGSRWIIVGGGIHGCHLAVRLLSELRLPREQLTIIDPRPNLLAAWKSRTAATGMEFLRSPAVHHIDQDASALRRFSRRFRRSGAQLFTPPYERPSLELFNAHSDAVIERYRLEDLHLKAMVRCMDLTARGVEVVTECGKRMTADRAILALGAPADLAWPDGLPRDDERIGHVFDGGRAWPEVGQELEVAVLGGGLTAAQVAMRLVKEGHRARIVARHALREHQFDSDPGWLGPKYMNGFDRIEDVRERRRVIDEARHRGSVTEEVRLVLDHAVSRGAASWHRDAVREVTERGDGRLGLELAEGSPVVVDRVLLATGFAQVRPGGALVDGLVERHALPVAPCGAPVLDAGLHWHPRLQVTGGLAELVIGPVARNIAGARRAADRILGALVPSA